MDNFLWDLVCPCGARQVTCGSSQAVRELRFQTHSTQTSRVAYLSMPGHLDCAISCLSRQDKAAFIVFRPFNGSDWPGQQGLLSGRSKSCSHFLSLLTPFLYPAIPKNLFQARQKQNPKKHQRFLSPPMGMSRVSGPAGKNHTGCLAEGSLCHRGKTPN